MRPDMFKVIVERARLGGGVRHRERSRDYDNLPSHEGMRRIHKIRGQWKSLNENLNPLRRFLQRRVGRRWDDVYAEICANLRPQSTVQQHVRDHIDGFVIRDVRVGPDGSLESVPPLDQRGSCYTRFFVDPRDGALRCLPRRKRVVPVEEPSHVVVGHERELIKVDGIWYWVVFADVPRPARRVRAVWNKAIQAVALEVTLMPTGVVDIVTGRSVNRGRYRKARRQANGRDLRRHGLANDAI